MNDTKARVTEIVEAYQADTHSKAGSTEELAPFVYEELRSLARAYLAKERAGHTLQPTALVNEAFLRLVDQDRVRWKGRTHFFAVGANMMRRVLVDHARRRSSQKRGGDRHQVTLSDRLLGREVALEDLLSLDAALSRLTEIDQRQGQVVELRFFAGLDVEETAKLLEVSKRTVEGDWTHARAWLRRELSRSSALPAEV